MVKFNIEEFFKILAKENFKTLVKQMPILKGPETLFSYALAKGFGFNKKGLWHDFLYEVDDSEPDNLSKNEVFEAIIHERKVELAGEQVRFADLVRWGLASQELSQYGFQEGIHELLPIPEAELNSNENINSEDQNPGY